MHLHAPRARLCPLQAHSSCEWPHWTYVPVPTSPFHEPLGRTPKMAGIHSSCSAAMALGHRRVGMVFSSSQLRRGSTTWRRSRPSRWRTQMWFRCSLRRCGRQRPQSGCGAWTPGRACCAAAWSTCRLASGRPALPACAASVCSRLWVGTGRHPCLALCTAYEAPSPGGCIRPAFHVQ